MTFSRLEKVLAERQPRPDLGNGYYRNPVLSGAYADPSVVRVGCDYYLATSMSPDVLLWHSRDLVNWRPLTVAVSVSLGDVWAPELVHHAGRFYLYLPIVQRGEGGRGFTNYVATADKVEGPWSELVDLGLDGYIDPGHVVDPDGSRWLYVSAGVAVPLSDDGVSIVGEPERLYDGWGFPDEWIAECFCLESPKFAKRDGWIYLVSAQGGTWGPRTSHMAVVARSRSARGSWENSPHNPLVRTASAREKWASQGHGTLVDDVEGNWWLLYHAVESGYASLGRSVLLAPVDWTADGWPIVRQSADAVLTKPAGEDVGHGMPLSDSFSDGELGPQWRYTGAGGRAAYLSAGGVLKMRALGELWDRFAEMAWVVCSPVNHSYEAVVQVTVEPGLQAGLVLQDGRGGDASGVGVGEGCVHAWVNGEVANRTACGETVWLKLWNLEHALVAFWSIDRHDWHKFPRSGDSYAKRPLWLTLYASGQGEVVFRDFRYLGLD